jgi:hypothetical protein
VCGERIRETSEQRWEIREREMIGGDNIKEIFSTFPLFNLVKINTFPGSKIRV